MMRPIFFCLQSGALKAACPIVEAHHMPDLTRSMQRVTSPPKDSVLRHARREAERQSKSNASEMAVAFRQG